LEGKEFHMNAAYMLGRILLSLIFVVAGIQKLMDVRATTDMLTATKIPIPDQIVPYLGGIPKYEALAYLVAAIEIICGLTVLIGLKARWGALVLIVFTAGTIILVHHFWDMSGEAFTSNLTDALKNLSIIGGLLLVVAVGSGPSAVDRR
jgi:putative oxidoreductase